MMHDFANWALETAYLRGAKYADARVMDIRHRDLSTKNGHVGMLAESESIGIGIRVLAQGSWGFASTDRLTREGIAACAAEAVAIAKASALAKRHDVRMVPVEAFQDTWQNPYVKDPFRIPLERQLELLLSADREMSRVKGVTLTETSMAFRRIEQLFASSIGSVIHQVKMQSGAGIVATSFAGNEIQKRSYPNSFGGQHQLSGYELVESLDLVRNAPRVAEEAVALHSAAQSPEGTKTIILDSSQLGLQIHESIGHPIELDRVLGMEANFAGMSFLTLEKLDKLRYGSDIVNVVADARLEHGPGLDPSGGTMRTESWNRLPIIRMTNISILPGTWRYEDLIADTDDAILMETNRSWSIDDKRYHFQFSTEIAWEIKGGKKTRMLKHPSYSGITTEFWNSCDAICSREHWTLWGTPNCGKGQPMQTMGTGHGASPARFRNVKLGAAFAKS